MIKLFKIECLKIKTYRTFWVLLGAFLLLFPLSYIGSAVKFMQQFSGKSMEEVMLKTLLGSPYTFPKVWQGAAWMGGIVFVIVGMLFIMLITNEVQYKTHRQNIIDGWDRMDFIKAKTTILLFFVIISTALVFVTAIVTGLIYTPDVTMQAIFEKSYFVLYFALMAFVYLLVAFLIAIFIKRTGLSIIIYFVFVFIIDNLLWAGLTRNDMQLGYFLPLESVDSLIPQPFGQKRLTNRTVADWALLLSAACYIFLMGYSLIKHFKNTDLKS